MSDINKLVRVYDFDTRTSTSIPAAELAPGMVQAQIEGLEGTYWIDLKKVKHSNTGPFRHPPFDQKWRGKIRKIMGILEEVHPLTFKQWEDGFRRDLKAHQEIDAWVFLAETFSDVVEQHNLDLPSQKRLLRVLLDCQSSAYEHVRQVLQHGDLPEHVVNDAVEQMYHHPKLKMEFEKLDPNQFSDPLGNIPNPISKMLSPDGQKALKAADLIWGVDCSTGHYSIFFGLDTLKKITATGQTEKLGITSVLYDSRTDQLELLVVLVTQAKGSCCYGEQ